MMSGIQREIGMKKTFAGLGEQAAVSLGVAAGTQGRAIEAILSRHELTSTRYNVLRILRGCPEGCSRGALEERLIFPSPDVTRIVDRLAGRGLVTRKEDPRDRRVTLHRITPEGLRLLDDVEPDLASYHRWLEQRLGKAKLGRLIEIAEEIVASLDSFDPDGPAGSRP